MQICLIIHVFQRRVDCKLVRPDGGRAKVVGLRQREGKLGWSRREKWGCGAFQGRERRGCRMEAMEGRQREMELGCSRREKRREGV